VSESGAGELERHPERGVGRRPECVVVAGERRVASRQIGRLGVEVDSVLPYALVGVAFANGTRTGINGTTTDSQTHTGWTAGVGVEAMVADNLSVFAEYRYTDYGSRTYAVPSTPGVDLAGSSVRVGLNYHF